VSILLPHPISRRALVKMFAGAAAAPPLPLYPFAARAQHAMPVIGLLSGNQLDERELAAIRQGLGETGYLEGKNVSIEYRSAEGHYDRLPDLSAELARRPVALILAIGGTASAIAAKAATSTVPIVFSNGGDPVQVGLVPSLNRPGGNITGVSFFVTILGAKRLELLRELMPNVEMVGYLANPANSSVKTERADIEAAARTLGLKLHIENAATEDDLDAAFAGFIAARVGAVIVAADAFFLSRRAGLAALAARHTLPAIGDVREHALAGELISYGTDRIDAYRQGGIYAAKVLKGEKPADLPVMQSVKFELVINLKTAKALGLAVPRSLLALANEVVE
jgi:putative ABC transport system substrate-binding protein